MTDDTQPTIEVLDVRADARVEIAAGPAPSPHSSSRWRSCHLVSL